MAHSDDLIGFTMDHQQPSIKFDYLWFIIEMLLQDTAHAADHPSCHIFDGVEGRHEDQKRDISISCKVRGSSCSYRSAHD